MKTNFLGDTHAKLMTDLRPSTIQLGDFHLYGYDLFYDKFGEKAPQPFPMPFWFIDGNHENFLKVNPNQADIEEIRKNLFYIPRGYVSGKVLFIGGADSIDRMGRVEGYEWFPEERITYDQISKIMGMNKQIEVVVTHTAPEVYVKKVFGDIGFRDSSAIILNNVLETFKPKLWVHGHFHKFRDTFFKDCRFISLGIEEYYNVDVPVDPKDFT